MIIDFPLLVGSFLVAVIVGLTGMGGGALMTPMLLLFFNVPPLAAVSSDLVASAVMKPVGGYVHMRRGTVNLRLVGWLCAGSVPAAFCGVLIARAFGEGAGVQQVVQYALGVALLLAVAGLVAKAYLAERDRARMVDTDVTEIIIRPIPTVIVGIIGGVTVGISSVGSGSLIIVALLALYPALKANQLVGTDLVQAVPLVAAAAVGHLFFGDFQLHLTLSLILGSIPGVYLGARISSRAPGDLIRSLLAVVLLASALKLLEVSTLVTVWILCGAVAAGLIGWRLLRRRRKREERAEPAPAPATACAARGTTAADPD
jgi:uncharacterized membrane protein YfcA